MSLVPAHFIVLLTLRRFKMTPALGAMMADFALEKDLEPWRFDFCSPDRFR